MAFIEWDDKYDIHVDAMNNQHKHLMSLMNNLFELNESKAAKPVIGKAIADLGAAAQSHFADEEAYMESLSYPELARHKIVHKQLLEKYGGHAEAFAEGEGELSKEFFNFIRLWLAAHIQGIDMKYGDFANKQ